MASIHREIIIDARPAAVWDALRDVGAIHQRLAPGFVTDVRMEEGARRWRPIEYLPNSWCGNSYHHLDLRPGRHWTFHAPVYAGVFRTQMRFVLDQPALHLVSNEFAGTINLEQFEKRQG